MVSDTHEQSNKRGRLTTILADIQPSKTTLNCSEELYRLYKKDGLTKKELEKVRYMKKKQMKVLHKIEHILSIIELIRLRETGQQITGSSFW